MKKKKRTLPRPLIKGLGDDIKNLVKTNEGLLLALEIIDEIPPELRALVVDGLSSFGSQEMAEFFYVLMAEYGKELEGVCHRGLEKLQMKGLDISVAVPPASRFFQAYVTRTRHTGQVTLDVAWENDDGLLDVECFFLSYNSDGIHGFFVISEMPISEYEGDRRMLPDMVRIDYSEACFMIQDANAYNVNYLTRPALGKFIYGKYFAKAHELGAEEQSKLIRSLTAELDPRELVNTFFYAQRYKDHTFINSIIDDVHSRQMILSQIEGILRPENMMVEGQAIEVKIFKNHSTVKAYGIYVEEDDLIRYEPTFHLIKRGSRWFIDALHIEDITTITTSNDELSESPFENKVYCFVYEILDLDCLFENLEDIDDIREVGELPFGVHLRINQPDTASFSQGVYFLSGIMSDVVINGNEMVIIAREMENVTEIDEVLTQDGAIDLLSRHEVDIITAYTYLSGQYLSFENMLHQDNQELLFEDGLRLVTARYAIKDRDRVSARLNTIKSFSYHFPGDFEVYYECEDRDSKALRAEYVLGNNWVTVSAFGDNELSRIRAKFESGLRDCLEFEGTQIKCEGIFEIITADVKKLYPELETRLQRAYLEKWFRSNLKPLRGMTPCDAVNSVEGKRLLWSMFKDMRRNEKFRKNMGVRSVINLKQYIQ
ncbi:MAG: hypothetical protein GX825_01175, partial [Syntrophomonadaceae bacterium]|nr:hypothetical protein [Syntrophomonadaceae bacterium]